MDDKVTFKSNGDYTFGAPISEMDVHQTPADEKAAGDQPTPTATKSSTGKGKATKKFDLSALKKKTDTGKSKKGKKDAEEPAPKGKKEPKTEPAPVEEPKPEPAPVEEPPASPTPQPPVEEPPAPVQEAPAEEAPAEETVTDVHVDPDYPPVHVPDNDPPIPAYEPEEKPKQDFKLSQLGLSGQRDAAESAPPAEEPPKDEVKKMDLGAAEPPKPQDAPKEEPKVEAPPAQENPQDAPPFVFHKYAEFLELTGLDDVQLRAFIKAVVKASFRGASIWESKALSPLRAYSCMVPSGRHIPATAKYLVTLGWDVHVTSCYISGDFGISDGSSQLTCVGTCALVQGTPVALSMERKRNATVL